MKIRNPATGEVLTEIAPDGEPAVVAAALRARQAAPGWAATPWPERAAALERFDGLLAGELETGARILTRETGKPITQARSEIRASSGRIRFFLDATPACLEPRVVMHSEEPPLTEEIGWDPLGVVACISAWNYPYFVGLNVIVPGLLTGNAVLYKPSEHATLSGRHLTDLLHRAGVPGDVFQCLAGDGSTGRHLVDRPVDGVFFTGSDATGRALARQLAGRLVRLQLELGGKDPAYVADDVDPVKAAGSVAEGVFYNTGQSCCAVERVYVHAAIYDAFLAAFMEVVRSYAIGDPLEESTFIGPLARDAQRDVLEAQIADALARGGRVLLGGGRRPGSGWFFEPTVVVDVDHTMALMREESFGPVIGIQRVLDDDEAIRWMNDTDHGLTAAVYSADATRARRILARVDSGSSYWNCCDRVSPRLPWTGRRSSGLGVTLSELGIQTFLKPRAWHLRGP